MIAFILTFAALAADAVYIGDDLPQKIVVSTPSFLVPESRMDMILISAKNADTFEVALQACREKSVVELAKAHVALLMAQEERSWSDEKVQEQAAMIAELTLKNDVLKRQRNFAVGTSLSLIVGVAATVYVVPRIP